MTKPVVKKRAARPAEDEQTLPAAEELKALAAGLSSMADSYRHGRAFSFLRALANEPPRAILLEGGDATERAAVALFWGMTLNCAQMRSGGASADFSADVPGPCYSCPTCLQFLARMHNDLFFLDGSSGNISIDDVRAVRGTLGEVPREARYRTVILSEAQHLTEAAANAMLKSLEEALPTTKFVLTAPQRERLLPTLVSRSWVVTLAWPDPLTAPEGDAGNEAEKDWVRIAVAFFATGKGFFEKTGARGGVDAHGANALVIACQRALTQALSGFTAADVTPGQSAEADLARYFALLPERRQGMAASVLAEGQESVSVGVNPALVVDWVMTRLYMLKPRRAR
jgi:DNA polymerase-3 subunit delta'